MSNTTKINFSEVKIGDVIRITIEDCGIGTAVVLTKDKDFMTINIDRDTFTPCYDCQSLSSSLMDIHENEIHEIILINRKEETKMKKTNIHAEGYLRKEDIRKELETYGIKLSNTKFKETRREALLGLLEDAKAQQPTITEVTPAQPVQSDKRREKYNLFCHLVKTNALENKKKGYGHVVSAYMLCAHILKADYGLEKLKGHENEVTPEQRAKVKEVRNFMIDKGHIKAVTWSYNNVTYYSSEYDGNNKNFMVPVEKAPKDAKLAVTTYKVMW